jgi:hypothetical protein
MKQPELEEDEIITEVRRVRAEHASRFHYDFAAICRDHRRFTQRLKNEGWKIISPRSQKSAKVG